MRAMANRGEWLEGAPRAIDVFGWSTFSFEGN
jgi:hypothetical protein